MRVTHFRLAGLFASLLPSVASAQRCAAAPSAPALDHVVLVVRDLERASTDFEQLGFRLKPGRMHTNNLLNNHVKFRDGSGVELMTVRGRPGDAMAEDYANLLGAGEGGVYVALRVANIDAARRAAAAIVPEARASASGAWRFVGFPSSSPAAAVFFSSGVPAVRDADSLISHTPDVAGLAEAWVEGGEALHRLLERLGATPCGAARSPSGVTGVRLALGRGSVVVVPAPTTARLRVLGVVLGGAVTRERVVHPHPAFWVWYRADHE